MTSRNIMTYPMTIMYIFVINNNKPLTITMGPCIHNIFKLDTHAMSLCLNHHISFD